MKLKRDIYSDPDRPMDKALMLIERAREAKKADVRADLLTKAAAELTSAEAEEQTDRERIEEEGRKGREEAATATAAAALIAEPGVKGLKPGKGKGGKETISKGRETPSNEASAEPSQKGVTFGEERFRQGAKERARLWAAVVRIAVEAKLWEVAHIHTRRVLGTEWGVNRDRDMVLLQADVAFLDAEACVGVLRERGIEVIPPEKSNSDRKSAGGSGTPEVTADVGGSEKAEANAAESSSGDTGAGSVGKTDSGPRESVTSVEESFDAGPYQERAFGGYLEGAQKGLALNEAWLVTNAAASLWNLYLPLLKAKRYAPLVPVFQPMLDALLTLPATVATRDAVTVCGVANALASGHVHAGSQRLFRESRSGSAEVPPVETTEPPAPDKVKGARGPSPNPKLRKSDSEKEPVPKSAEKALPTGESKAAAEAPPMKLPPSDASLTASSDAPESAPALEAQQEERNYTELLSWALDSGRKRCENAPELLAASEVCSKAIEKMQGVDESVLKVLVATHAKVQGLRGLGGAAAGDHALGASGKAVALIELASNTAESAGVRAKAVADAVEALQKGDGTGERIGTESFTSRFIWNACFRAKSFSFYRRSATAPSSVDPFNHMVGGKSVGVILSRNTEHDCRYLKPICRRICCTNAARVLCFNKW